MTEEAAAGGFDVERFFRLAGSFGHGHALGIEFRDSGSDWVELALPWRAALVGIPDQGFMASGAIVSLIDNCSGSSVWCKLGAFRPAVTLDLRLDYLRPALSGETVVARCRCFKITRQVAFVDGIAHGGDPDRPIARSAATFMLDPA